MSQSLSVGAGRSVGCRLQQSEVAGLSSYEAATHSSSHITTDHTDQSPFSLTHGDEEEMCLLPAVPKPTSMPRRSLVLQRMCRNANSLFDWKGGRSRLLPTMAPTSNITLPITLLLYSPISLSTFFFLFCMLCCLFMFYFRGVWLFCSICLL